MIKIPYGYESAEIEAAKNAVSNVLEIHLRPYEHNYIKVADNIADEIVSDLIAQNILLPLP